MSVSVCAYTHAHRTHLVFSLPHLLSGESHRLSVPAKLWRPLGPTPSVTGRETGVGYAQDHSEQPALPHTPAPSCFPLPLPPTLAFALYFSRSHLKNHWSLMIPGPRLPSCSHRWRHGSWGRQLCTLLPLQVPWMKTIAPQA